jgi:hypothetical protein
VGRANAPETNGRVDQVASEKNARRMPSGSDWGAAQSLSHMGIQSERLKEEVVGDVKFFDEKP